MGSSFIEQLVSLGRYVVRHKPVENYLDATILARSVLMRLLEGLYEGSGSCIGMPQLRAGDYVDIRGVGKRFSGRYKLSKVSHTINESGYQTHFELSQNANSALLQSLRKKLNDSPSPDKQDSVGGGVMIGKVENNIDPEGLGRVQLSFPNLSDVNLSNWARVVTPMAGGNRGVYFLPDVGDEVLVTFEQGSINKPLVLGALWNGIKRPAGINLGLNEKKMIKLKSGMQILFDETPGVETLTIKDKMGSSITMSSPTGDITIEAKGNVIIKSGPAGKIALNP